MDSVWGWIGVGYVVSRGGLNYEVHCDWSSDVCSSDLLLNTLMLLDTLLLLLSGELWVNSV